MGVSSEVRRAIDEWDAEVNAETVRLIKRGWAPYDAIEKAKQIVSSARESRARLAEAEAERVSER